MEDRIGRGGDAPVDAAVGTLDGPGPSERSGFAHVRALDGVRGLAVSLVVLFHFAPQLLPAGFLGVDVFFVLSGFLISTLALGEHRRRGRISAPAFYARRARRLLPAAIVTIVVSVAIAIVLDPASYRTSLRGQAVASLLYVNNWWAIRQHDTYQAVFGAESPLTHFWSLSIEEQFYIVLPVVLLGLVLVARHRREATRTLALSLFALAAIGAIASALLMAVRYDPLVEPSPLYYGTDTRLQSVLLGVVGGCAVWLWGDVLGRRVRGGAWTVLAAIATVVLVVSASRSDFVDPRLYRGGFFVLAAIALVLVASVVLHRGPIARVFELRPVVVLGVFSYGIYLWHWPVKVFLDQSRTGLSGPSLFALRVAVTAVATWMSARFVEAPFRSPRSGAESPRIARALRTPRGAVAAVASIALACAAVWIIARPTTTTYGNSVASAPSVEVAPDGPLRLLWTGDSVAWTMGGGEVRFPQPTGFATVFDPTKVVIWNLGTYPCSLIAATSRSLGSIRSEPSPCWNRSTTWPAQIAQFHPDAVVWDGALFDLVDVNVNGNWVVFGTPQWDAVYLDALDAARRIATENDVPFVILGQNDPFPFPDERMNEALLPQNLGRFEHLRSLQRRYAAQHPDTTHYVDLQELLCPTGTCPRTSSTGTTLLIDGIHWSVDGARTVAPVVAEAIAHALGRPLPS